ncbi:hepatitis A virus cellular receptor 1 homolog [Polymixia lowei]
MCPLYLLLSILIKVCEGTVSSVVGIDGRNVTLPCRYDVRTHGALHICWGRGEVPRSKCSKPVISSWDGNVDFRLSPRYQLLGKAREGDMSLTILHAQTSDSGMYGCRVEIPGWFNDLKFNIHLVIEEEPVEQTSFPLETQSVTQDYILPTEDSQEMLTETPAFETLGTENPLMTVTPEVLRASKGEEMCEWRHLHMQKISMKALKCLRDRQTDEDEGA